MVIAGPLVASAAVPIPLAFVVARMPPAPTIDISADCAPRAAGLNASPKVQLAPAPSDGPHVDPTTGKAAEDDLIDCMGAAPIPEFVTGMNCGDEVAPAGVDPNDMEETTCVFADSVGAPT